MIIIQQCYTGFGDSVLGFASAYIFVCLLRKMGNTVDIYIEWPFIKCPFIDNSLIYKFSRQRRLRSDFRGEDGYKHCYTFLKNFGLQRIKGQYIIICNQCLCPSFTLMGYDYTEINNYFMEGYKYFWSKINYTFDNIPNNSLVIHTRFGDQYLVNKLNIPENKIIDEYKMYDSIVNNYDNIILLGDIPGNILKQAFMKIYDKVPVVVDNIPQHSVGCNNWQQIFDELNIIYNCSCLIFNNDSNFPRLVTFLKPFDKIFFVKDKQIKEIKQIEELFCKHYDYNIVV